MAKTAIITDSNSGITQVEAKELGVFVVPMPFMINGEDYFEDINLSQSQFYEKLADDASVSTSQPSPDSLMTLWEGTLKDYDEIVYIPMPIWTNKNVAVWSKDYEFVKEEKEDE